MPLCHIAVGMMDGFTWIALATPRDQSWRVILRTHTVVPQKAQHSSGINSALDISHVPLLRCNALRFGQALSKIP